MVPDYRHRLGEANLGRKFGRAQRTRHGLGIRQCRLRIFVLYCKKVEQHCQLNKGVAGRGVGATEHLSARDGG